MGAMLISSWAHAGAANSFREQYRVGPGDVVEIDVQDEEEFSVKAKVLSDGTINYPYIGELKVGGLALSQLEQLLTAKLKADYLVNPRVSVSISDFRKFYVNGEVGRSGEFSYAPGLTVRKAITLAGGFSDRANERGITVIRGDDSSQQQVPIGLDDPVFPDDLITVPEGFW
ncbi:MAG: polysaccharide export protein [Magnetococcus sp. WYHC-3]